MKPLRIDFAAPSLARTVHRTGPLAWLLVVASLLLCAGVAVLTLRLVAQQRADAAALAQVLARASTPVVVRAASAEPRISPLQAASVNAAVLQLNLPWRALRDAIGSATPASIALLALEPDARKRTMKITAEAKSSEDMVAYVAMLKQQELFETVSLTRHEISDQDPNRPIRFQLDAEWRLP